MDQEVEHIIIEDGGLVPTQASEAAGGGGGMNGCSVFYFVLLCFTLFYFVLLCFTLFYFVLTLDIR